MTSTEKFCLKWNDFHVNIGTALQEIRYEHEFFDVTLASGNEQIQAHKVILSACSPFFRSVLKKNKHDHPLVYLKGVKFAELLSILNFMYNGEVNIAQDDLSSFLAVAEDLKIKGLSQNVEESSKIARESLESRTKSFTSPNRSMYGSPPAKRSRTINAKSINSSPSLPLQSINAKEESRLSVKPESRGEQDQDTPQAVDELEGDESNHSSSQYNGESSSKEMMGYNEEYPLEEYEGHDSYEEGDIQIDEGQDNQQVSNTQILKESRDEFFRLVEPYMESTVGENGKLWICKACGHNSRTKQHIMNHVEMKHSQGPGYSCPLCNVRVPSYQALHKHISRNHNPKKKADPNSLNPIASELMPVEYMQYAM